MTRPVSPCPVVAVAGSAGAYRGLFDLLGALPADFPAAILVALHLPPDRPSELAALLDRTCALSVQPARDGLTVEPGHVYTAVPNHHLLLEQGRLKLSPGPRENRSRPSLDVLLRSAALLGPDAAGVLLSGLLDDGVSGLWAVQNLGGLSVAQHPDDAEYPDLPLNAIRQVEVEHILPISQMPELLLTWATRRRKTSSRQEGRMNDPEQQRLNTELQYAAGAAVPPQQLLAQADTTPLTCPECGGVLTQLAEGQQFRYRCHTGHAFTSLTLLAEVRGHVEKSLWSALRAVQEKRLLLEQLLRHSGAAAETEQSRHLQAELQAAAASSATLRQVIAQEQENRAGKVDESTPGRR